MTRCISTSSIHTNRWDQLITSYTPKENLDFFASCERKLAQTITSANKVPEDIPTIDWKAYEGKIKDKSKFKQIKSSFEKHTFEDVPVHSDGAKFNNYVEDFKKIHEKDSQLRTEQINNFKKELAQVQNDQQDFVNWTIEDIYKKYPGIEDQWREEYLRNEYFSTEDEEKLATTDIKSLMSAIEQGEHVDVDLPNIQLGQVDIAKEKKNKEMN